MTATTTITKKKRHWVIGGIAGFFCLFGVVLVLLTTGTIPAGSILVDILPLAGLVAGIIWGLWGPLGSNPDERPAPAPGPGPAPTPGPV
ncbi:MAG TPA: hypothetical protein VGF22_17465, partial [Acidimicrobiales bacterium]